MQVQRKKIVFFIVLWNFFLRKGPLVAPKLIFLPSSVRDCCPIGFGFLRSGTEQKAERKNWGGDLATHQFYTAKARPVLAGTPSYELNKIYFKERTFSSIILITLINSSSLFPVGSSSCQLSSKSFPM